MTSMNKVFADLPVTIFEAMSQAARDNNAINLGQGFPDDPGPEDIRRAAADASINGYNQYPSMMGIPELRQAIASHYGHWHGLKARSDDRGDGHLGRHRGADRLDPLRGRAR
ncbi:aspartate/methionine/tyrosine aminotransferase [Bradyrhizobium sp. USDA 4513]